MEITGKIALVTGAARRVGRTTALALAHRGADVVIHYGRSAGDANALADEIKALGRRAIALAADLADPSQIEALFAAVSSQWGRLDILVNNASIFTRTPLDALTAEQWDRLLAVNARAPALCIRHALPLMTNGGAIVNITDITADKGLGSFSAYCASKAALLSLTKSAAKALAGRNIRVNAVAPGVAEWAVDSTEAEREKVLSQVPMNRPGSPQDIASAIVFLIESDYITAQSLRVDGGWAMS